MIRTGPWEFSRDFVVSLRKHDLRHEDGYIRRGWEVVPCAVERVAFDLAGMPYIEPWYRGVKK